MASKRITKLLQALADEADEDEDSGWGDDESEEDEEEERDELRKKNKGVPLEDLVARYTKKVPLKVGDKVCFKRGLDDAKYPTYKVPGIIVEVLDPPAYDTARDAGSGNPHWRTPLNVRVGLKEPGSGAFLIYHFDGNRLELWEEKVEKIRKDED